MANKIILQPIDIIRYTVALLIAIHGIARIYLGIVDDFGAFLNGQGFPAGNVLAWLITIFEVIGALLLVLNYQVQYVCMCFILQLTMGLYLVHYQFGWFVVGAGNNGMEYSFLLIVCFAVITWSKLKSV